MIKMSVPKEEQAEIKKMLGIEEEKEEKKYRDDFPRRTVALIVEHCEKALRQTDIPLPVRHFVESVQELATDERAGYESTARVIMLMMIMDSSSEELSRLLLHVDLSEHKAIISLLKLLSVEALSQDVSKNDTTSGK